ncbi:hypothetical protein H1P_2850001 [Hyella patelloides LEGE 07179]|uniref:Uncharacterized protein n=1 Tax=Hyella patelloides LEGE 07179 TaxID=945734 RepID=A0A563VTI6_9CYAN|nr:hypothetical protein H1P_2850001 [Hyella patelloides LEGE 07179]
MGGAEEFCRETTESAPWVSLNEQLTNPLGGLTSFPPVKYKAISKRSS